jgi:hypothetical protein
LDPSVFVPRTFFNGQVDRIFDSISSSTSGLSNALSKEVNTKLLSVSGNTTLGGDLTVAGTSWTATPTISGLITATSGITANGVSTFNNNLSQVGAYTFGTGTGAVSLNGATTVTGTNTFNVGTGLATLGGNITVEGATGATFSGNGAGVTFSGTGNHDITALFGTLRIGANTIIGNILAQDDTVDIGTVGTRFDKIYANEINATTLVGTMSGGNVNAEAITINFDNATADTEDSFLAFERGSVTPNAFLQWDSTGKKFILNAPLELSSNIGTATFLSPGLITGQAGITITGTVSLPNSSITNANLANSTISGISLGSNLATLTIGDHLSGTSYNGGTAATLATDATDANTASTLVARDASGNFSAGTITGSLTGHASLDLPLAGGTLTGNLIFSTDNTLDIGANGTTRPRTGYFGTSVISPVVNATTGFQINGASNSGTILKGNGTNFIQSTETYAAPGTSGNVMTSDGTNWTSVAPTGVSLSSLSVATATNTIDNTNYAQTWNWSTANTQNPLSMNFNALTTGSALSLLTSNASLASTNGFFRVANTDAATGASPFVRLQPNSTAGSGITLTNEGNVGINTTTPGYNLDVNGSAAFGIGTEVMRIADNGYVGIGTATPSAPLEVKGNATHATIAKFTDYTDTTSCTLSGGGLIACSSDARLKKNVDNITYGLSTIMSLRPVLYNWNYEADGSVKNLGFIAQEVEALVPKLISTDEEGMKSLNTIGMIPILTKAIQEMNLKITDLSVGVALLGGNTGSSSNTLISVLFDPIITMFKDIYGAVWENGVLKIAQVISDKLTTKELCLEDICINKTQLKELLEVNNLTANVNDTSTTTETCSDGIMNQDETDVDTGDVCTEASTPSDISALTTAKVTAEGLITTNATESTTPGDHIIGSLTTLTAANTAASATSADLQSVVDEQVSILNAAIAVYNLAIIPTP